MAKPGDSTVTTAPSNPVGVDTAIKAGGFSDADSSKATAMLSSFVQWRDAFRAMRVRDPEAMALQVVLHG